MSETPADRARQEAARRELQILTKGLREQARHLGEADAIAAADRLHEHVTVDRPDAATIRSLLESLETKIALSPTVNAILQALSNIGL
jgi:hypothetical protein